MITLRILNIKREARKILLMAARLLRKPGRWGQGAYVAGSPHNPCYCVTGALACVAGTDIAAAEGHRALETDNDQAVHKAWMALYEVCAVYGAVYGEPVVSWNDRQASAKPVTEALRQAAKTLR